MKYKTELSDRNIKKCKNCCFWIINRSRMVKIINSPELGDDGIDGICVRYPKYEVRHENEFCGEHPDLEYRISNSVKNDQKKEHNIKETSIRTWYDISDELVKKIDDFKYLEFRKYFAAYLICICCAINISDSVRIVDEIISTINGGLIGNSSLKIIDKLSELRKGKI